MKAPAPAPESGVTFRLSLPCDLAAVRPAAFDARNFLATQTVDQNDLAACEMALVEACNNAILYVATQNASRPVEVHLLCNETVIELHVIDHTPGFELSPTLVLPESDAEHGRGLYIIRSLMDETIYLRSPGENRLVLRKLRRVGAGQSSGIGRPSVLIDSPKEPSSTDVEQKLALSEQVIGAMTKEICFRSEELAAIFRCTSELGRTNNLEEFSQRLLNDLLHIAAADWFILRLRSTHDSRLLVSNASSPELRLPPINLPTLHAQPGLGTFSPVMDLTPSAELEAALSQQDFFFDPQHPLATRDPLAAAMPGSIGLVRPIVMGNTLLGTLVVGRKANESPFSVSQIEVVHTFSDFLAIQIVNSRFQAEQVDVRLTAHELQIARNIQRSLLPKNFPELPGFGLAGFCLSARQVGGDFYDVLSLSDHSALLVVADVMGKGVPAALFSATLRTLLRTMAEWTHRPSELLSRINRLMLDELSGVDMFITAQLILVDLHNRQLVVASAGHCPLVVAGTDGKIRTISPDGMPLGILPSVSFREQIIPLDECRCALLYTDGLTEARNPHGELFGEDRLHKWLKHGLNQNHNAAELSKSFLSELNAFQSSSPMGDDQTFLILAQEPHRIAKATDLPSVQIAGFSRAAVVNTN
jgi:serine phosphatase RsbU (regulator of sigma subunit)/anti-sigma regulatory factor (Ser/Thr protein kinase)